MVCWSTVVIRSLIIHGSVRGSVYMILWDDPIDALIWPGLPLLGELGGGGGGQRTALVTAELEIKSTWRASPEEEESGLVDEFGRQRRARWPVAMFCLGLLYSHSYDS